MINYPIICLTESSNYSDNIVFAGTDNGGVYFTTNIGLNWLPKNDGFPYNAPTVLSFLIANNYLFIGTDEYSIWRRPLSDFIGIKNISSEIPSSFSLSQNYPNPFNPSTKIKFEILGGQLTTSNVQLIIYDILGKEIATLVNEKLSPGTYEVPFSINQLPNNQLPSGLYFYTLTAGDYKATKRMILIK